MKNPLRTKEKENQRTERNYKTRFQQKENKNNGISPNSFASADHKESKNFILSGNNDKPNDEQLLVATNQAQMIYFKIILVTSKKERVRFENRE